MLRLRIMKAGLAALIVSALAGLASPRLSAPAVPAAAPASEPEFVRWWNEQANAAEAGGDTVSAAGFRARAARYGKVPLPLAAVPGAGTLADVAGFTEIKLYAAAATADPPFATARPLAKHEPASGVYLGMLGADKRVGFQFERIEPVYGRKHALILTYVGWRKVQADTNTFFPKRNAERVKALGGALQIAWEPRYGLQDVKDDEYVRTFAREAKASGIPIFLRFAAEMNGAWVPWHGDPAKYIEKFRLVRAIMAEEAPNVAMVWSPNFAPADTIDQYYPGDDAVDWVGFSLYATPLAYDGKVELGTSLIDLFTPLYDKYSRKPIMISEGAVAHTVIPGNTTYLDWAESRLGELYEVMPRLFPQLKAVTYFNYGRAQSERNNMQYVYDLGEQPALDAWYRRYIRGANFLSEIEAKGAAKATAYDPIEASALSAGRHDLIVYAKLAEGRFPSAVALFQGARRLGISYEPPWAMTVEIRPDDAAKPISAVAYDDKLGPIAASSIEVPFNR